MEEPAKKQPISDNSILNYAWERKKEGLTDETINTHIARLTRLSKLCDLNNPNGVKETLANLQWKNSTKRTVTQIYTMYLKYLGKEWEAPRYKKDHNIYFIPTEQELDALISASRRKTATRLQLLKETGARIGETEFIEWNDIDQERKLITIRPEKGSNARILPISPKLIGMLNQMPKDNKRVFPTNKHSARTAFEHLRKATSKKLNNPRLLNITLHTFRHWKGTMEYHKTKDIIHVQYVLGHRNIKSTMVYINLENAIFQNQNNEWTCKVAHNEQEAIQLIETGFEYVSTMGANQLYRKRK